MKLLQVLRAIQEEQKNKTLEQIQEEFYTQKFIPYLKSIVSKDNNVLILDDRSGHHPMSELHRHYDYIHERLKSEKVGIRLTSSKSMNTYIISW